MKLFSLAAGALALLLTGCRSVSAEPPATNQPAPRLTVELRDGSRVIGQSADDSMKFHSALLGDLKLAMTNISTLEFTATNAAKLTAANGDVLAVQTVGEKLPLQTSFGPVKLALDSIRRLSISPSGNPAQRRPGLVALWSGEDNGDDSVNGNSAKLEDISFADGKVGRAFVFNGTSSYISIPNNPVLDVGTGDGFTVMAWIKPTSVNGIYSVIEWKDYLCAFEIGQTPSDRGVLLASVFDADRQNHFLRSNSGAIIANQFQHVALTYDKPTGIGTLYVNGIIVAQSNLGSYIPQTKGGLRIGYRPSNPGDWTYKRFFSGLMDEIAIYNRALSTSEIQAVAAEENHGEALPPPAVQSNFNRSDVRF